MKRHITAILVGAAALAGLAFSGSPTPQQTLEERVQALETQVADQRAQTERLASELAETHDLVERTVRYLQDQAKSASKMSGTLDASEQAGFTYGINPESRTLLLAGWRDQLAELQKGLPSLEKPQPPAAGQASGRQPKGQ
jgi:uncharacterized coiled-coil protein SlyX